MFTVIFSEKYKHWEIITNGGHQFKIEEKQSGAASVDTIGIKGMQHIYIFQLSTITPQCFPLGHTRFSIHRTHSCF